MKSEKRTERIISVLTKRQLSLTVVLENIHDPHNVSAIFRTCDATGIGEVSLIYNEEKFPKIGKKSSASAFKWVDKKKFRSVKECYADLRNDGFRIYASAINENSKNLYDLDLTGKTAIVLGNEHRGVSKDAASNADDIFLIPMHGMVQSLNVSVAAAVILYEAQRQRALKGMYDNPQYTPDELNNRIHDWLKNK